MTRKYLLLALCAALSLGSAAAQNSDKARAAATQVQLTKATLQRTGESLLVRFGLVLDSLQMPSNMRFVYTPGVVGAGEERLLDPIIINGRKQQVMFDRGDSRQYPEQARVVRRTGSEPQSQELAYTLPFEPWMKNCDVVLYEDLCGCGDLIDSARHVLGGQRQPVLAFIRPKAEIKTYELSGEAFVDFPVNRIELYPDYRQNPAELQKIIGSINTVREDANATITAISIHGYASPEGSYDHNVYLAENRARTLTSYVRRLMHLPDSIFTVRSTPEDWAGLRRRVEQSNLEHRAELLAIIDDTTLDPDARDHKMRDTYPEEYRFMLQTWYPALRHSDYVVEYTVRSFTADEARELIHTKPQQLSLQEMFLVAEGYEPGTPEFNEVFQTAVRMYPADPTANLNAAMAAIASEDYAAASRYLERAGSTPEAVHARAIVAQSEGRTDEARRLYEQAARAGLKAAEENLRNLNNF